MKAWLAFVLFAAVVAVSCNKKEDVKLAPMGDAAPKFGSAGLDSLQTFAVGRWAVLEGIGGLNPVRYFDFKADGTFETGEVGGDYTSTGKWSSATDHIVLTYETMKGKSFEAFRAEYKKDEEGGGQVAVQRAIFYDQLYQELAQMNNLWVDEDAQHLTFSQPTPPAQPGSSEEGGFAEAMESMSRSSAFALERMGPQKTG